MRYMGYAHEVVTHRIAHDRDDIGHHSSLSYNKVEGFPTLIMSVESYDIGGQENGKQIDKTQHCEFIS